MRPLQRREFFQSASAKEVRLLWGPDRQRPEGARGYALMLVMLRPSLRVSEVCSPRTSSVKWSHGRWTLRYKVKGGREEVRPRTVMRYDHGGENLGQKLSLNLRRS